MGAEEAVEFFCNDILFLLDNLFSTLSLAHIDLSGYFSVWRRCTRELNVERRNWGISKTEELKKRRAL
jgi:hypothetical protein